MMINNGLSEMDSIGEYFTWCNIHTKDSIHSMIDRLISNVDWFNKYGVRNLKILPPSVSDHALLQVDKAIHLSPIVRKFKNYNYITELAGYKEAVRIS